MNATNRRRCILSFLYITFSLAAHADKEGRDLTEAEWQTWPQFCKYAFLNSEWSVGSPFKSKISRSNLAEWFKTYEQEIGIYGPHHLCLAQIYLNRAKPLPAGNRRDHLIKQANSEVNFSYSRTPKSAPQFSLLAAQRGNALKYAGKLPDAIDAWHEGISQKPEQKESYLAMASSLLSSGKYSDALEILERYDSKKKDASPDGEYFMGYTYYKLNRIEDALIRMRRAVQLGYPYSGLLLKLEALSKKDDHSDQSKN